MSNDEIIPVEREVRPSEIDAELRRVERFQNVLGRCSVLRNVGVELDFDERVPVKIATDQFFTYEYDGRAGLYLDSAFNEVCTNETVLFSPRIARVGKNSAHGVFFGDIQFINGQTLPVAVKPHEVGDVHESAIRDHLNGKAIRSLGLYSLQPVGVMLTGSNEAYSLTVLEETLTTLDSVDWSEFYPMTDHNPGMIQIWSQVARQTGFLHSLGSMSHGDLAGRNIAVTADNYVFPIDWEMAHVSLVAPRDAEVRYEFSHPDLLKLVENFCRPPHDNFKAGLGIFFGKEGNWWQAFRDLVFDEYIDIRKAMVNENGDKVAINEVNSELEVLDASLQQDMAMNYEICHLMAES